MPRTTKKKSDPVAEVAEALPAKPAPAKAAPAKTAASKPAPAKPAPAKAAPIDDDFDALFDQLAAERTDKLATAIAVPADQVTATTTTTVALEGELTIDRVAHLKAMLQPALASAKASAGSLRLDLSAVSECDGAGMQLLLSLAQAARKANADIELQGTPPRLAAIFGSYGVAGNFKGVAKGAAQ